MLGWLCLIATLPRPTAVITLPAPETGLPRLASLLDWLSLAVPDLATHSLRDHLREAGLPIDPFDPKALLALGLDPSEAISIWFGPSDQAAVIELAVRDDALLRRALAGDGKPRHFGYARLADGGGVIAGDEIKNVVAAVRDGRRLFIQFGRTPGDRGLFGSSSGTSSSSFVLRDDPRLLPIAIAKCGTKPRVPPRLSSGADLWLHSESAEPFERIRAAMWISAKVIRARAELVLDFTAGLVASDLASKSSARALWVRDPGHPMAAELLLAMPAAPLRELASRTRLPPVIGHAIGGALDLSLTESGDAALAISLRPKMSPEAVQALVEAVTKERPALHAAAIEGGPTGRLLILGAGSVSPSALMAADPKAASELPSVWLSAAPLKLFEAFRQRAQANDHFGPSSMQLMAIRLSLKPFLDSVAAASMGLRMQPTHAEVTLEANLR